MAPRQRACFGRGAIGDHQALRLRTEQRTDDALCRAARSHQQHAPARDRASEVDGDVAQQADAVGVVAAHAARVECQGIHDPCRTRPFAERVPAILKSLLLERQSNVCAAPAGGAERVHGARKTIERRLKLRVFDILPCLAGELGVEPRRLRVGDGVADHRVAIHHALLGPDLVALCKEPGPRDYQQVGVLADIGRKGGEGRRQLHDAERGLVENLQAR